MCEEFVNNLGVPVPWPGHTWRHRQRQQSTALTCSAAVPEQPATLPFLMLGLQKALGLARLPEK